MQNANSNGREFNLLCRTREVLKAGDGVNCSGARVEGTSVNEVLLERAFGQENF